MRALAPDLILCPNPFKKVPGDVRTGQGQTVNLETRAAVATTVCCLEVERVAALASDLHDLASHFRMILCCYRSRGLNYDLLWIRLHHLSPQPLLPAPVLDIPDEHQTHAA